jgi:hypothetical protein
MNLKRELAMSKQQSLPPHPLSNEASGSQKMEKMIKFPWAMSYVSRKSARRKRSFFAKNVRSENWKRDGAHGKIGARGRKNAGCGKRK